MNFSSDIKRLIKGIFVGGLFAVVSLFALIYFFALMSVLGGTTSGFTEFTAI